MYTPGPGDKIIIADDKEHQRELVKEMIETIFEPFPIEFYNDGNGLKSRLERGVKDVKCIITDNDMINGPTGSQLILQYAGENGIPPIVLIYGANDSNLIGEQAVKDGAVGYLKKPYTMSQFKEVVRLVLGYR